MLVMESNFSGGLIFPNATSSTSPAPSSISVDLLNLNSLSSTSSEDDAIVATVPSIGCGNIASDNRQPQINDSNDVHQQQKQQLVPSITLLPAFYQYLPPHFICHICAQKRKLGSEAVPYSEGINNGEVTKTAKLLPCLHSLCSDCLAMLTAQHKFLLPCPICKQHFPIPKDRTYPDNRLLLVGKMEGEIRHHQHSSLNNQSESSGSEVNDSDNDSGHRTTYYCPLHDLQPLEYFCQTCDYAVCVDCLRPPSLRLDSSEEFLSTDLSSTSSTSASRHEGHSYVSLSAAKNVERLKIGRLAQALQMRIGEAEDAAEHLKSIEQNLNSRLEESLSLINKSFEKIVERVQQRKRELEVQLLTTCQQKQNVINTNRQAVSTCIASAKESADFLTKLLENSDLHQQEDDQHSYNSSNLDLLAVRKQFEQQTEVVLQPFPLNTVQLEETQLLFTFVDCAAEKLLRSVDNFGAIISSNTSADMSLANSNLLSPIDGDDAKSIASIAAPSTVSGDYLLKGSQIINASPLPIDVTVKLASSPAANMSATDRLRSWSTCIVNVPQVVMLTAVDEHGQDAALPANHDRALTVVIRDAVERVGTCDLKRVSGTGFLLTFTIPKEGIFEMEVCLFGMPVSSSPFVVRCYPAGTQLNTASPSSYSIAQPPVITTHSSSSNNSSAHQLPPTSRYSQLGKQRNQSASNANSKPPHNGLFQHFSPAAAADSKIPTPVPKSPAVARAGLTSLAPSENGGIATPARPSTNNGRLVGRQSLQKPFNSPMLRAKAAMSPVDRTRSRSTCGHKLLTKTQEQQGQHAADCPSHHINNGHADSVKSTGADSGNGKAAELEQLRNFCKRVVLLTSGNNNMSDLASTISDTERSTTAIPYAQIDDFLFSFGRKGRGRGEFSNIQDVCVTPDGRLIVSDSGNQCVQVFSSTGEYRFRFGQPGRNPGQLARPTGLATSPDEDKIYLADYENRCVHVFHEDGRHVGRLGVGRLLGPKGICLVPGTSLIVVVDNRASEVSVFDIKSHKLVSKFGSRGSHPHQLAGPHFVVVLDNRFCSSANSGDVKSHPQLSTSTSRPRIAITDFHNHAVKVFDLEGNLQSVIGNGIGEGLGQFNAATGLAVDNADGGTLYAADWGNSRVEVFGAGGTFRNVVNCFSGPPLFGPQGLAIDSQKMRLIVADSGNHCIKVFRSAVQTSSYI